MSEEKKYEGSGVLKWKEEEVFKNWALVIDYGSALFESLVNCVFYQMGLNVVYVKHELTTDENIYKLFNKYNFDCAFLSGSGKSVNKPEAPYVNTNLVNLSIEYGFPILAICYSMEHIAFQLGIEIVKNKCGNKEEGPTTLELLNESLLWNNIPSGIKVHMYHEYEVDGVPEGFKLTSKTENCEIGSFEKGGLYCTQFHPEYPHSIYGKIIIKNFLNQVVGIATLSY